MAVMSVAGLHLCRYGQDPQHPKGTTMHMSALVTECPLHGLTLRSHASSLNPMGRPIMIHIALSNV